MNYSIIKKITAASGRAWKEAITRLKLFIPDMQIWLHLMSQPLVKGFKQ